MSKDEFQGKEIHATKVTLSGGGQEIFEDPPELDQIVRVVLEGRVTGVDHRVNDRSGDLDRNVRVKVMDIDSLSVLTYPREVTMDDGKRVDPDTGEVLGRAG